MKSRRPHTALSRRAVRRAGLGERSPIVEFPENIGRYRILDTIADGAFAVVFLAHDPLFEEDVAIKLCKLDAVKDERERRVIRKLFFNEIKSTGRLVHPNIVGLRDANEVNGWPYLVMEYVRGAATLREFCKPELLLSPREAAKIVHSCAKALDYAHKRGIVHRDIKPENLLLTPNREVKVGDFGIAHRDLSEDTEVVAVLGSPRYMSPEQMRGEPVSASADLYSLGVVLYELLTGHAPFNANNVGRLMHQVLQEEAVPPSTYRSDLSPEVDALVLKAMEKEPADRQASGEEFAAQLAAVFGRVETVDDWLEDEAKFQLARACPFFRDFSQRELWELVHLAGWRHFRGEESVSKEGGLELSFHILLSGQLRVKKGGKTVATLARGDCFGESGYIGRSSSASSIVAASESILLCVDSTTMSRASPDCRIRFNDAFIETLIWRLSNNSPVPAEKPMAESQEVTTQISPDLLEAVGTKMFRAAKTAKAISD